MNAEPPFTLIGGERAGKDAQRLFGVLSKSLAMILPARCDIRHVGSTAVSGCLTKGDLDIVVRVPAEDFQTADRTLASKFSRNDGSIRTATFSSFEDASSHPHLGIQLVAFDGPFDFFHLFVEALQHSPALVEEYNALKRRHEGGDMARYRSDKDQFIQRVLADVRSDEKGRDADRNQRSI